MAGVFISYASQTRPVVQRVADQLRALGHEVWWDDELLPHRPFAEVIEERLAEAAVVLVVWSEAAVHSQWVRAEADFAMKAGKLVQAAIGGVLPPMPFNQIQCEDLAHWSGDPADPHWRKVAASIAALTGAPAAAPMAARGAVKGGGRRRPPLWAAAAGVIALALLAGGGFWVLHGGLAGPAAPGPQRVAILPFDTLGAGPDVHDFAASLQGEILQVLSSNDVQTVSQTDSAALRGADATAAGGRLGLGLILDGTVEETAGAITVRVHLDDAADHTVLWSKDFEGPASPPDALQAQVAARATEVTSAALAALKAGVRDPPVIADYVATKENSAFNDQGGLARAEPFARRVVAAAPQFADGHGSLAMMLAIMGRNGDDERAAAMKAEAETEARRALALDPHTGTAYAALSLLRPNTDWAGRETWLAQGLAADPSLGMLQILESRLLRHEGRLDAATERARQAVAAEPLQPWVAQTLAYLLAQTGQTAEDQALLADMTKKWPADDSVRDVRFWVAAEDADPGPALALLAGPPPARSAATTPVWRQYLLAIQSGRAADRAAAAVAVSQAVSVAHFDPGEAMVMLTRLGDLDGAFVAAGKYADAFNDYYTATPPFLFDAQTRPMRRDPRFMAVAARMGLVAYWRATGKWPDFCAEPDLPYSCAAEAAKLMKAAGT